jgi:hypothetical protein
VDALARFGVIDVAERFQLARDVDAGLLERFAAGGCLERLALVGDAFRDAERSFPVVGAGGMVTPDSVRT